MGGKNKKGKATTLAALAQETPASTPEGAQAMPTTPETPAPEGETVEAKPLKEYKAMYAEDVNLCIRRINICYAHKVLVAPQSFEFVDGLVVNTTYEKVEDLSESELFKIKAKAYYDYYMAKAADPTTGKRVKPLTADQVKDKEAELKKLEARIALGRKQIEASKPKA